MKNISLVLLSILFTLNCLATTEKMNVFVLFSYLPGVWSEGALRGVNEVLASEGYSNFQVSHFDYDYVRMRQQLKQLKPVILNKIKRFNPDLIIIFDDEAADDFMDDLNRLNIPIVATGLNKSIKKMKWYKSQGDKSRNFTGILERYPFEEPLKILKKISPKTRKINILTTQNISSDIIRSQLTEKFKAYGGEYSGIKLKDVISSRDWEIWKKEIKSHRLRDEAFWILVPWDVYDQSGQEVSLKEIGKFYQENSLIPEMGIVNAKELLGMLACFSVNSEDLASEAVMKGIYSIRNKIPLNQIPFETVKSVRVVLNSKRSEVLKLKIPKEFLDFATIEKKLPLSYFR